MEVLLTNDDGIDSQGLRALGCALHRAGHTVHVVAPDGNRSASSHFITLFTPLHTGERKIKGLPTPGLAIGGTPTDCAKLGLSEILKGRRPDAVVSGINLGANLGTNIFYSGTIGGAYEGVLAGLPAFAISIDGAHTEEDFDDQPPVEGRLSYLDDVADIAARMVVTLVDTVPLEHWQQRRLLYNINFPDCPPAEFAGVRMAPQGQGTFVDEYEHRQDPRGRNYYWLSGIQGYVYPEGTQADSADDLQTLQSGHVTVTPLSWDLNCASELERGVAALEAALPVARGTEP